MDHLIEDTKYLKALRSFYRYGAPRDLEGKVYPAYIEHLMRVAIQGNIMTLRYFIEKYGLNGVHTQLYVGDWTYCCVFEAAARHKREECARIIADLTVRMEEPQKARHLLSNMLLHAAEHDLIPLARYILTTCLDNKPDGEILYNLFHMLIGKDTISFAEYLVEMGLHLVCAEHNDDILTCSFYDLCEHAIEKGNLPFVRLYLRLYMEIPSEGRRFEHMRWLFSYALSSGRLDILQYIESVCPPISARKYDELLSLYAKNHELVRYLFMKGCDPTRVDVKALFRRVEKQEHREMADVLLAAGVPERNIYNFHVLEASIHTVAKISWIEDLYGKITYVSRAEELSMLEKLLSKAMNNGEMEFFMWLVEKIELNRAVVGRLLRTFSPDLGGWHVFLDYLLERNLLDIADAKPKLGFGSKHGAEAIAVLLKHGMDVQDDEIIHKLIRAANDDTLAPLKLMLERGYKLRPMIDYLPHLMNDTFKIYSKKFSILLKHGIDLGSEADQLTIARAVMRGGTYLHLSALLKRPLSSAIMDTMMEMAIEKEKLMHVVILASHGAKITTFSHPNHSPMFVRLLMQHGARTTCFTQSFLRNYGPEHHAQCVLRRNLTRMIKEYLYHPCGRHTTEDLELWSEHGDVTYPEEARERLREERNELVEKLAERTDLPELPCEVPLPDGTGVRSLLPYPEAKLTRLQHLYRLPTSVLRGLSSSARGGEEE